MMLMDSGGNRRSVVLVFSVIVVIWWPPVRGDDAGSTHPPGFCPRIFNETFFTPCTPCQTVMCPNGTIAVVGRQVHCTYVMETEQESQENAPKEEYIVPLRGCRNMCQRQIEIPECCPGFWGHDCTQECPGGADNPCSGHGNCSDTIKGNGVCSCAEAYGGAVCEFCKFTDVYGPACNQSCGCLHGYCNAGIHGDGSCDCESGYKGLICDQVISPCDHITCSNISRCIESIDGPTCICNHGYEMTDDHCQPIDLCDTSPTPCHPDAACVSTGPATYRCECKSGFEGDGVFCLPINPCLTDNGGCPVKSTHCIFNSPGQSECMCRSGYENYTSGSGCQMIDLCRNPQDGSPVCHKDATCMMDEPGKVMCTCNIGYIGSGYVCFGNIMKRIVELNNTDETLRGRITKMAQLLSTVFGEMLRSHGPYTLFIPVDDAFSDMEDSDTQFSELLEDMDAGRHQVKQHLLPVEHTLSDLVNTTNFYNLAGVPATLSFKRVSRTLSFRLIGTDRKATVLEGNLVASNGIMHVIDTCMNEPPIIDGQKQKTLRQQIQDDARYNRFESLMEAAGLGSLLDGNGPLTVFVSSNKVWDSLPEGTLQYLRSPEGKGKLLAIMRNHIVFEPLMSWDLISMSRFTTYSAVNVLIKLTRTGQIQLDGHINVTQTDIPASNGYYHHISDALIPASVKPILPSRCDTTSYVQVQSLCNPCHMISCPGPGDEAIEGGLTYGCVYSLQLFSWTPAARRQVKRVGCHRTCNRTIVTPQCCAGFYGHDCLSCPGGFLTPCYDRGQCVEGYYGTGECQCEPGFRGTVCELCEDPNKFGPNCDQECTCLHGSCDNRVEGTGTCTNCNAGYTGLNCHLQKQTCGDGNHCHATEICVKENGQCVCDHGFRRLDVGCEEINPCMEEDEGGCHSQARCVHTGPSQRRCECESGWTGDGYYCTPIINCTDHTDCHSNAECLPSSPGQYECICGSGYYGNGSYCELNDTCLTNNGGCHPDASCQTEAGGLVKCQCPDWLAGDGLHCYGDILYEISTLPDLSNFYNLLEDIDDVDDFLHDVTRNFTVFVPTNVAMGKFMSMQSDTSWRQDDNILTLLRYHTIPSAISFSDLQTVTSGQMFSTLANDYAPVKITSDISGEIYINGVHVIGGDVFTLNGRIHFIDQVLESRPLVRIRPSLEEFLQNRTDLSFFGKYLLYSGLSDNIEKMNTYTLFIPPDGEWKQRTLQLTEDYARYYISPHYIPALNNSGLKSAWPSLGDDGANYRFNITSQQQQKVLVNGVEVRLPGYPTRSGIVYFLNNILPVCPGPTLTPCDVSNGGCDVKASCSIDNTCQLVCMCSGGPNVTVPEKCPANSSCGDDHQGINCNPSNPRSAAYLGLFKSAVGMPIVITISCIVFLVIIVVIVIRLKTYIRHMGSRRVAGNWSRLKEQEDEDDHVHFTYEPSNSSPTKFENPLYKAREERVFLED